MSLCDRRSTVSAAGHAATETPPCSSRQERGRPAGVPAPGCSQAQPPLPRGSPLTPPTEAGKPPGRGRWTRGPRTLQVCSCCPEPRGRRLHPQAPCSQASRTPAPSRSTRDQEWVGKRQLASLESALGGRGVPCRVVVQRLASRGREPRSRTRASLTQAHPGGHLQTRTSPWKVVAIPVASLH